MADESSVLSFSRLAAVLAQDKTSADRVFLISRLAAGEQWKVQTPFMYPGRLGPVVMEVARVSETQAAAPPSEPGGGPFTVRFSDAGLLLECLADQGMDVQIDMILSRTLFHAARQFEGAGIRSGRIYVDAKSDSLDEGIWRFLQLLLELVGLRHSKYKDALVQFERRRQAEVKTKGMPSP